MLKDRRALFSPSRQTNPKLKSQKREGFAPNLIFKNIRVVFHRSSAVLFILDKIRDSVIFIALFKTSYLPNGTANLKSDDGIGLSSKKYPNKPSSKKCADARGARHRKPEAKTEKTLARERVKLERWDQRHSNRLVIPHLLTHHSTTPRHFRSARRTSKFDKTRSPSQIQTTVDRGST